MEASKVKATDVPTKIGDILTKTHKVLEPYIYGASAMVFILIGVYLFGKIMPIIHETPQPRYVTEGVGIIFALVIVYWSFRMLWLTVWEFAKRSRRNR